MPKHFSYRDEHRTGLLQHWHMGVGKRDQDGQDGNGEFLHVSDLDVGKILHDQLDSDVHDEDVSGVDEYRLFLHQQCEYSGGEPHDQYADSHPDEHHPELIGNRNRGHHVVQAEDQVGELHHQHHRPEALLRFAGKFFRKTAFVLAVHAMVLRPHARFSQVFESDLQQVERAKELEPWVFDDESREEEHQSSAHVSAEKPHFQRCLLLVAEEPVGVDVDVLLQERWPRYGIVLW